MTADLSDRLAALRIEVTDEVAEQQLAVIAAELATAPPRPASSRRAWRRAGALIGAVLLVALPAAAVAAESSVPGDVLYPVKRVTEWGRSLLDDTIAAEHRVDELETVLERGAPNDVVADRVRDAEEAVADLPADDPVRARLVELVGREESPGRTEPRAPDTTTTTRDAPVTTTLAPPEPPSSTAPPRVETPPAAGQPGDRPRDGPPPTTGRRDEAPPPTSPPQDSRGGDERGGGRTGDG